MLKRASQPTTEAATAQARMAEAAAAALEQDYETALGVSLAASKATP
jgi:hypothetical protein